MGWTAALEWKREGQEAPMSAGTGAQVPEGEEVDRSGLAAAAEEVGRSRLAAAAEEVGRSGLAAAAEEVGRSQEAPATEQVGENRGAAVEAHVNRLAADQFPPDGGV